MALLALKVFSDFDKRASGFVPVLCATLWASPLVYTWLLCSCYPYVSNLFPQYWLHHYNSHFPVHIFSCALYVPLRFCPFCCNLYTFPHGLKVSSRWPFPRIHCGFLYLQYKLTVVNGPAGYESSVSNCCCCFFKFHVVTACAPERRRASVQRPPGNNF